MSCQTPLVTVIIATYCSEGTIVETLNSIFEQTFHNIELIVTDDNSKDNTTSVVSKWIEKHKNRFANCLLIESDINTGVSENFNRGLRCAKGDWIKPFGGDDILFPEYIETLLSYSSGKDLLISRLYLFSGNKEILNNGNDLSFVNNRPTKKIAKYYSRVHPFFNIPTLLVRREVYEVIGYYDKESPYFEDVPFIIKFFKNNLRAAFVDIPLVWYRVGGMSHQGSFERGFQNNRKLSDVCKRYLNCNLSWSNPVDFIVLLNQTLFSVSTKYNRRFLYRVYCSRFNVLNYLSKKLSLFCLYH